MQPQTRKATVRALYEKLFNDADLSAANELATPDFIDHAAPPNNPTGPDGMRSIVTMVHTAFPDAHYAIHELIEEGDKLVMWTTLAGTHLGPFMGMPPTGRPFSADQMHLLRMEGNRVAEHWAVRDDLKMMRDLGLVPAPNMQAIAAHP